MIFKIEHTAQFNDAFSTDIKIAIAVTILFGIVVLLWARWVLKNDGD